LLLYSDLQQTIAGEGEGNSLAVNRRVVGSSPMSGVQINNLEVVSSSNRIALRAQTELDGNEAHLGG
jgi:hypothetical protein